MRLDNKVALISGGASGMSAAEARLFAKEGAKVVIGDILEEAGHQTEAEINETGGDCLFVTLDVTSESDWQAAVAFTVARFGKLDILVNNAGISTQGDIEEQSQEDWDLTMAINAKGVFLGTKYVIDPMRRAGGAPLSISPTGPASRPHLVPRPLTPPPRERSVFLASRRRCNTPRRA